MSFCLLVFIFWGRDTLIPENIYELIILLWYPLTSVWVAISQISIFRKNNDINVAEKTRDRAKKEKLLPEK
jgi:hypothetical protein